jgi:hypothetical protein
MIVLGAVAVSVWPQKGEVESSAQVTLKRQTPTDERQRHLLRWCTNTYMIQLSLCISASVSMAHQWYLLKFTLHNLEGDSKVTFYTMSAWICAYCDQFFGTLCTMTIENFRWHEAQDNWHEPSWHVKLVHFQLPLPASTFAVALCNAFSILIMFKQNLISEFESTLTSESSDPGSLSLSTWSFSTSACTSGEPAWRLDIVNK